MSSLTSQKMILKRYPDIEKGCAEGCGKLNWGKHTDVLYSFNGIFKIGLYLVDQIGGAKRFYLTPGKIIKIRGDNGRRNLSIRYIQEHYDQSKDMQAVAKMLNEFAACYTSIGNVFPIWPGGNPCKGSAIVEKLPAYDIPDLFFSVAEYSKLEEFYLTQILNLGGPEKDFQTAIQAAQLGDFIGADRDLLIKNINELLPAKEPTENDLDQYAGFVKNAVSRIEQRKKILQTRIESRGSTL